VCADDRSLSKVLGLRTAAPREARIARSGAARPLLRAHRSADAGVSDTPAAPQGRGTAGCHLDAHAWSVATCASSTRAEPRDGGDLWEPGHGPNGAVARRPQL